MLLPTSWEEEFTRELEYAQKARANGNEGMARVCARRAAGIVLGEYLRQRGYLKLDTSVKTRVSLFNELPDVSDHYKEIAGHFLWKVNLERQLPINVDLIHDASFLRDHLLQSIQG